MLITPWLDTAVPLYALEIAGALRAAGHDIVFLFDSAQFALNAVSSRSHAAFRDLHHEIAKLGEVHDVTAQTPDAAPWPGDLKKLAYENAVWRTKGEVLADAFLAEHPELPADLAAHGAKVHAALQATHADWLLMPGGVFGVSGLYMASAQSLGLDFTTFDSGPGRFFTAHRGIAAHSADLPDAFARLTEQCAAQPQMAEYVRAAAAELFREREEMRDHFQFQTTARSTSPASAADLLVCLNYRADTAALFRNRCFPTVEEWVVSVLDWAAARGLRIRIRPHPVQRRSHVRSTDQLDQIIHARDPEGRTAEWIAPDAPVNSYDLIESSRVVLPFTSTVGIEAAYLGRPVVLAANNYYESLGFATLCSTPGEYFAKIERALAGEAAPSPAQREAAARCLYLAVRCRSVHSLFTPQPADFAEWVKIPSGELWSRPETADLLHSLTNRIPLTWVRHERRRAAI